jgi:hypothetical protein
VFTRKKSVVQDRFQYLAPCEHGKEMSASGYVPIFGACEQKQETSGSGEVPILSAREQGEKKPLVP